MSIARSKDVFIEGKEVQKNYLYKYHNGSIIKLADNYRDYVVKSNGGVVISKYDEVSKTNVIEIYDEKLNKKTVVGDAEDLIDLGNTEKHNLFCS